MKIPNVLRPYRYLPFSIKHSIREAIDRAKYHYWTKRNEHYSRKQTALEIAAFQYKPKISIVMPVYNTHSNFLELAIRSVVAQFYQNWELCICDDASTEKHVRETLEKWQARDPRIKVVYSHTHEHISGASNRALALATGEFIGLFDHDDILSPAALFETAKLLQDHPDADMIYSDEDRLDPKGRRVRPGRKPDWRPELMLESMYTCHFGVYRKSLVDEIGGFRKGFEGSQDYDLVLRLTEKTSKVHHIPKILYHWRMAPGSGADHYTAKPYALVSARRAIAEHLQRCGIRATVQHGTSPGFYRVLYNVEPLRTGASPPVSIIVPNYNHAPFLRQRIDSILNQTFQDFELILLDDASTDDSRSILSSYASDPRVRLDFNGENSGSAFKQWNKGVRLARGEYIWIAESDDYADPRLLERLVPLLDADPQLTFAYCRSLRVLSDGSFGGFAESHMWALDPRRWEADFFAEGREECARYFALHNPVPNASAVLFRKAAYEQIGGADESLRLCADWKLWAALALIGRIAYISEPLNYFRFHDATVRTKTGETRTDVMEAFKVIRWMLTQVTPPKTVRDRVGLLVADMWVPVVMSFHVPLDTKRSILHEVLSLDPHPLRNSIRPALRTIQRKFARHWPRGAAAR